MEKYFCGRFVGLVMTNCMSPTKCDECDSGRGWTSSHLYNSSPRRVNFSGGDKKIVAGCFFSFITRIRWRVRELSPEAIKSIRIL